MVYKGNERFILNGDEIDLTMQDFWQWAYSDLLNNMRRSVLAEFIVASSLGINAPDAMRVMWQPYDLMYEGLRIEVKSAAYVQSWDIRHPDHISFRIAPAKMPDDDGDYHRDTVRTRNSDVYVFCIYKATSPDQNPLDLDLWDFYTIATKVLDEKKPNQKTITLPRLMDLGLWQCDYYGIAGGIEKAMDV